MNQQDLNRNVLDHFPEKYLKPHHLRANNIVVTFKDFKREKVYSKSQGKHEDKIVCYWVEDLLPMVLNKGNSEMIIKVLGSNTLKSWIGKKIVLGTIPDARFNSRVVVRDQRPGTQSQKPKEKKTADPKSQYIVGIRKMLEVYTGEDIEAFKKSLNDAREKGSADLDFYFDKYTDLLKSLRDQITEQFNSYLGDDYDEVKKRWIDGANVEGQSLQFFIDIATASKN